ncbi:serine hydrolase domain-containing protein [Scopulibacillus cellulosilyticus]|uniref:Serine hydrolase domain-containing protein n=1 Tax=Scopulibacillus cellulosilyticus TaxID=2665665 RepID=A0ABW2PYV1_9BACL
MRRKSKEIKRRRRFIGYSVVYILLLIIAGYLFHQKLSAHSNESVSASAKNEESEHQTKIKNKAVNKTKPSGNPPVNIVNSKNIDSYLKSIHFNGSAMVVKDGKVVIDKGYGFANREKRIKNNSNTVYYIGSITKSFVSTALMQLQEKGKVNVHDSLAKYLPNFPHANQLTLFDLLTHTSGIREIDESQKKLTREQLMQKIGKNAQMLMFAPGTRWAYSDSNYSILGYVVEKVSGESLHDYIQQHIFQPAGMNQSGFGTQFKKEPYPSTGYKIKNGTMYTPAIPDFSQLFGCGDIYTTASDLYKFDHALASGKLVSKESYKQIFTPFKATYGFGWYIDPGSVSSHGVLPGWNGLNSYGKSGKVYVVLLSNIENNIKSFGIVNNNIYTKLANDPAL